MIGPSPGKRLCPSRFAAHFFWRTKKGELRGTSHHVCGRPLHNEGRKPIAALGLRIRPDDHFTRILQVVRFGHSGETYAFDRNGLLLSQSRFDDDLKQLGLLVDQPDSRSILTVEIRDPQVNMVRGTAQIGRAEQPLTRMAAERQKARTATMPTDIAITAECRRSAPGAREDYDFGIATEVDLAEAFRPVYILHRAFWILMGSADPQRGGHLPGDAVHRPAAAGMQKATLAARKLGGTRWRRSWGPVAWGQSTRPGTRCSAGRRP